MKNSTLLKLLLTLTAITVMAIPVGLITVQQVNAEPVPKLHTVVWEPNGANNAADLEWNPEYLKLHTTSSVKWHSTTTIHVTGLDTYGQPIEATVVVPANTQVSKDFYFVDPHSNQPVAFAKITGIFQQNGTESTFMEIDTEPEPWEDYIGMYETLPGFEPGQYYIGDVPFYKDYPEPGKYWVGHGYGQNPTQGTVPLEPSNPDPLKICINWHDYNHDLLPTNPDGTPGPYLAEFPGIGGGGAKADANITIEGLDQNGEKLTVTTTIHVHDKIVSVNAGNHTWADVCKVWGGSAQDEYEILTEPNMELPLFKYYIWIDHLTLHPKYYDILANPTQPEGKTQITVALRDQDGHLVHANQTIILNWQTSGGKIEPSYDISITKCHTTATVNLTADTNPRTIKVVVDANVPPDQLTPPLESAPARNLLAWTEMTFDGVNSVLTDNVWPIHTMTCGYTTMNGSTITMNAPFEPPLEPPEGPEPYSLIPPFKLDGPIFEVIIPFYPGCNLISCPVHPIMLNWTCEAYGGPGIPMELLFGNTSATDTIEAIWWYNASGGNWDYYIPGVTHAGKYFTDGVGYWIKAEKQGTLEISGVIMENAPFVPPEYPVYDSWNLMGVTSIWGVSIDDYLECLRVGDVKLYGPVWVYYARYRAWVRNPSWGFYPTEAFWVYYKDNDILDNPTLAP
jgi:hypothetical protein